MRLEYQKIITRAFIYLRHEELANH